MNNVTETYMEYPDNSSLATILYMRGCSNMCKGCHNLELKTYQELPLIEIISSTIELSEKNNTKKLVLCGGDPLYPKNIEDTKFLLFHFGCLKYDICIYTGYDIEYVKQNKVEGFKYIKCGPYLEQFYIGSKKTDEYIQFATSNQALYDSQYNLLSKDGIYKFN